jgi:hypothetical protein
MLFFLLFSKIDSFVECIDHPGFLLARNMNPQEKKKSIVSEPRQFIVTPFLLEDLFERCRKGVTTHECIHWYCALQILPDANIYLSGITRRDSKGAI